MAKFPSFVHGAWQTLKMNCVQKKRPWLQWSGCESFRSVWRWF